MQIDLEREQPSVHGDANGPVRIVPYRDALSVRVPVERDHVAGFTAAEDRWQGVRGASPKPSGIWSNPGGASKMFKSKAATSCLRYRGTLLSA